MRTVARRIAVFVAGLASLTAQQPRATPLQELAAAAPARRIAALRTLARIEPTASATEAVALALCDGDHGVRRAAVGALLALRPDLEPLRARLRDVIAPRTPAPARQRAAGRVRRWLLPDSTNPAAHELEDADPQVRARAVVRVCNQGPGAATFEAELLALRDDADTEVRAAVVKHIGKVGQNETIRAAVIAGLKDPVAAVRRAAAEGMTPYSRSAAAVAALRGAIQDPDVDVRAQVLRALGRSGEYGTAAVADIVGSLRDREPRVRVAALEAVVNQGLRGDRAMRDTLLCLDDDDHKVLAGALRTVAITKPEAADALRRVTALTRHDREEIRRRAITAAWSIAPTAGRGALVLRTIELIANDTRVVAKAAAECLREHRAGSR